MEMKVKAEICPAGEAGSSLNVVNQLRGRQSVRTTFRLSEEAIRAVGLVAAHLGIRQKSLFDHLLAELGTLSGLGEEVRGHGLKSGPGRVQKTYVISRWALDDLERLAQQTHASRDVLVEFSVRRLMPVIEAERAQHERRKAVLAGLKEQEAAADDLLHQAVAMLGEGDPVCLRLAEAVEALRQARGQVEYFVERGRMIEERARDER